MQKIKEFFKKFGRGIKNFFTQKTWSPLIFILCSVLIIGVILGVTVCDNRELASADFVQGEEIIYDDFAWTYLSIGGTYRCQYNKTTGQTNILNGSVINNTGANVRLTWDYNTSLLGLDLYLRPLVGTGFVFEGDNYFASTTVPVLSSLFRDENGNFRGYGLGIIKDGSDYRDCWYANVDFGFTLGWYDNQFEYGLLDINRVAFTYDTYDQIRYDSSWDGSQTEFVYAETFDSAFQYSVLECATINLRFSNFTMVNGEIVENFYYNVKIASTIYGISSGVDNYYTNIYYPSTNLNAITIGYSTDEYLEYGTYMFEQGKQQGYNEGFDEAYEFLLGNSAYQNGYDKGYSDGLEASPVDKIFNTVGNFFELEFLPGFKIYYFLLVGLGATVLGFFIKMYLGG